MKISWSKPRVSFENSRGLGLMVSDNVPAASFGDSGRALLNKEIKEQPSNYAAMSSHKIHSVKFVLVVERDGAVERRIRSAANSPPNGRSRSNVLWEGIGEFFPAPGHRTEKRMAIN